MKLESPVETIPRVGTKYKKKLNRLGIKTIRDLLFHFPHRYEDFSDLVPISKVKPGDKVCIKGKILEIENSKTWKKRMTVTTALVEDETAPLKVVWFNQPYLTNVLKEGDQVCLAGKVARGTKSYPGTYLSSPTYEKLSKKESKDLIHTGRLIPVYPETEGLSSRWMRYILKPILSSFVKIIKDPLPEEVREKNNLPHLSEALWQIHFPDSLKKARKAKKRFAFEELLSVHLYVLREKMKLKQEKAKPVPLDLQIIKKLVSSLPFELTDAQRKCSWQVLKDLQKERPMNRLLEGDVGSGKTMVAIIAVLNTAKAGFQTAFMAPTEILAKQHFKTLSQHLKEFGMNIALLTGQERKIGKKEVARKKLLEKIKKGGIDVIIGTHALIQKQVKFGNLALVVLDEQHRFGVEQRAELCQQKGFVPHLLSMTATPIPRTLALTLYGDLDISLLDELPKGRKEIVTEIVTPKQRKKVYSFIEREVEKGKQVFVICPRIEPGETNSEIWNDVKAVEKEYEKLSEKIFPKLAIEKLHGKMEAKEKEKIMKNFQKGKGDVLVSTSVVEVGIDVPNATLMIIEGAERFGLAQLHQFRGRVGRSEAQSYCFLFTDSSAQRTTKRLKAIAESKNGFELAEKDLEIRGPGELFGSRQSGIPDLAMSSLKDTFLVEKTREWAKKILEKDRKLNNHPLLREKIERLQKTVHLE
ncbi:MAG: ATP-dependent DNA helicase RecG [Candidatus Nealsonbacteria bacterium]|nr:ATP-dependent DNA helicase RecG [Candidatus Nealsonbacteria bacterium]